MSEYEFAPNYKNVVLKHHVAKRRINEPRPHIVWVRAENIHRIREIKKNTVMTRAENIYQIRKDKDNLEKEAYLETLQNFTRDQSVITENVGNDNVIQMNAPESSRSGFKKLVSVLFRAAL